MQNIGITFMIGRYDFLRKYNTSKLSTLYNKNIDTIREHSELIQKTIMIYCGGYPKQNSRIEIGRSNNVKITLDIWNGFMFPEACINGGMPSPKDLMKALNKVNLVKIKT